MATARLDNQTKTKLERLFGMSGGYVLDFSNASFASFVETCIGFDPYERYDGSKASILRDIWLNEPADDIARLNLDLLEHRRDGKAADGSEPTPFEQGAYDDLRGAFARSATGTSAASLEFLAQDLGDLDLSALPAELTSRQVIEGRLAEIDRCIEAEAPLAVIFLVGSTLEGLLFETAVAHPDLYTSSPAAPTVRGTTKPLNSWTLAELITVSRGLGVVGEDVLKFAEHVRDFRNYIHPRQQLKANFEPRMITAQIAQHVLVATLKDLSNRTVPEATNAGDAD